MPTIIIPKECIAECCPRDSTKEGSSKFYGCARCLEPSQLVEQLTTNLEPLDGNAERGDVRYELLLKSGVSLMVEIEEEDGFYLVNDAEIALIFEKVDKNIY